MGKYKPKTRSERVHPNAKCKILRVKRRKIVEANSRFKKRGKPRKQYSLRYIGVVLRYISVRYGLIKRELEVILYIYNLREFTKEDFDKAVSLIYGNHTKIYRRFVELGYIKREMRPRHFQRKAPELEETGKLVLSKQVEVIVQVFYKYYNQLLEVDKNPEAVDISSKVMALLNMMDREVEDIESGKKKADGIIKTDDYEKQ